MAKVAHTKHPLSFPLCRVPLLSPWQDGETPLHLAAEYNDDGLEVAQALIAAGANLEAKDKVSST